MYSLNLVESLGSLGSYLKTRTFETSSFIRSSSRAIFRLCSATAEIYRLKNRVLYFPFCSQV